MARKNMAITAAGRSEVSVLDAALGVGMGVGLPALVEIGISRWTEAPSWVAANSPQVAGGLAALTAIPIFFLRGIGPALIVGAGALLYALGSWVRDYLEGRPTEEEVTAPPAAGEGATEGVSYIRRQRQAVGAASVRRRSRVVRYGMGNAMGTPSL